MLNVAANDAPAEADGTSDATQHAVEAIAVSKQYGDVDALHEVTLQAAPGEFLTLLGPSGSGKTTLLNIIAGFQRPDTGTVRFHGRDCTTLPAHRRNLGMVFQSYALFPHMTVAANVEYPLRVRRVPQRERERAVAHYLDLVELGAQRNRLPDELSGGQRQRVALARALVFGPDVILMDEPLGALDRRLRQTLQREIARIHHELRPTVIYVTHDQEEALALSTRIAVMRHGGIEHAGSPREIYDRPATVFAATFVGETNLLEVEVDRVVGDGRAGVAHRGSGSRLVVNVDGAAPGEHLTVAIRPEQLEVAAHPHTDADGLRVRRVATVFMGEKLRLECRCGDDEVAVHLPADAGAELCGADELLLVPRPGAACVFRDGLGSTPPTEGEQ